MLCIIGPKRRVRRVVQTRVDRRRRPFNRIPNKILDSLFWWELPALGKIVELHPPDLFPRVADVGGGRGAMACALRDLGYEPTIIDPNRPSLSSMKRIRGKWRRHATKSDRKRAKAMKGITVRRRKFMVSDAKDYDLLVGLRPCAASKKLVRAAKHRPLVMLPCTEFCRRIWPGNSGTIANIERCFRDFGVGFRRHERLVFWTGESRRNRYVGART